MQNDISFGHYGNIYRENVCERWHLDILHSVHACFVILQ